MHISKITTETLNFLSLQLDKSAQRVRIDACTQQYAIPVNKFGLRCIDGGNVSINSSQEKPEDRLYIPYPEYGTWYIALKRTCYRLNQNGR